MRLVRCADDGDVAVRDGKDISYEPLVQTEEDDI
jgi:hypothetical protein